MQHLCVLVKSGAYRACMTGRWQRLSCQAMQVMLACMDRVSGGTLSSMDVSRGSKGC